MTKRTRQPDPTTETHKQQVERYGFDPERPDKADLERTRKAWATPAPEDDQPPPKPTNADPDALP